MCFVHDAKYKQKNSDQMARARVYYKRMTSFGKLT